MVKSFHQAGIEVILDVVYNHTAEGNHLGPTLSFRGIDNPAYYRLVDDDRQYYMDYTGTGNSLNAGNPHSLQLIMDSLRYWVTEMHVDGFRFDLASALAREFYDVDRLSTFFELVQQDPVVSQVKLIAEPWDVGPGGYQVGNFPPQWTEWNGAYRDTVREFWRGEPNLGEFASRLAGSSDLYEHSGRRPVASINFVTAHDGFTVRDLVSYEQKHNEANGEDGRDGADDNRSWNHGVEGPTDKDDVNSARARDQRNLLATLLLSQGVPMVLHGDELGRTQDGNNNTYAQDSSLSWIDWDRIDGPLNEFVAELARLRHEHPSLRRQRFFTGKSVRTAEGGRLNDIVWLHPDGRPMEDGDWDSGQRALGMYLNGDGIEGRDRRGQPVKDDHFLIFFNGGDAVSLTLPDAEYAASWQVVLDTTGGCDTEKALDAGSTFELPYRSVVVLRQWHEQARGGRRQPGRVRRVDGGRRMTPVPEQHLPAADHRGLRPRRRARGAALPRRPRRGLALPVPAPRGAPRKRPRVRRRRSHADRPRAGRTGGPGPAVGRGAPPWHRHRGGHRAQPRRDREPGHQPLVVGRPAPRPRLALRALLRHRLGGGRRQGAGPGRRRRRPGRVRMVDRRTFTSSTGCSATTTTGSRSLPAARSRQHRRPAGRARPAALPAGQLARGGRGPRLPAVLRGQHPRRGADGGPRRLRGDARGDRPLVPRGPRRRSAGRPPGRPAPSCGLPRRPGGPDRLGLGRGREDPRAGGGAARSLADRRHDRL